MNLDKAVLGGVQSWYRNTLKDLTRARQRSRVTFGEQFRALGCPTNLSEAKKLLERLLARLQVNEERGSSLEFMRPLKRRARDLLQAVRCVESREGTSPGELVDSLLRNEATIEECVQHRVEFR